MNTKSPLYHRHRFPPEIISYCIWLYNSFSLSYRDVEKMMLYRGIYVTYEAIRYCASELIYQHTQPKRHRLPAFMTRQVMVERMRTWQEMTGVSVSI